MWERNPPSPPLENGDGGISDRTEKVYKPDILVSKQMLCREPGYNPIQ
jgi:hypothetical protein